VCVCVWVCVCVCRLFDRADLDAIFPCFSGPDPKQQSIFARLQALKLHGEEGQFRLGVLKDLKRQPTMELMVAPMETLSTIFLKLDKVDDAKLKKKTDKKKKKGDENKDDNGTPACDCMHACVYV